jgi:phosphate transport system protein
MVRTRYDHIIEELRDDLLGMGHMVEEALSQVMASVRTGDAKTAGWIIQDDARIDELQHTIEDRVTIILATQQPVVASDLRLVLMVGFIASELERVGDYAAAIARRVRRAEGQENIALPSEFQEMGALARQMLHNSLEAFLHQDQDLAHELQAADERVDAYEEQLRTHFFDLTRANPQQIETISDLLDMVHVFERTADRATNIGERVIYLVTNRVEELNP